MLIRKKKFDHKFPSCSRTYVTLCIYHKVFPPEKVTEILKISPDETQQIEGVNLRGVSKPFSGWFLGTNGKKNISQSKDMRAHVAWLLEKLEPKKSALRKLSNLDYEMRLFCFWESSSGNGGPELDHDFLKKLSEFPFDLGFDIWFENLK